MNRTLSRERHGPWHERTTAQMFSHAAGWRALPLALIYGAIGAFVIDSR